MRRSPPTLPRSVTGKRPAPEQRSEVVIPQEGDSGKLRATVAGNERIQVDGKPVEARRIRLDSGSLVVDLWVDAGRLLQKIAVADKKIEVVRARK